MRRISRGVALGKEIPTSLVMSIGIFDGVMTQIPKKIEIVSSEILARQMCNLGKIVCQTQMVQTQNVALKHLYLHVL